MPRVDDRPIRRRGGNVPRQPEEMLRLVRQARGGEASLDALASLRALRRYLDEREGALVRQARRGGKSWASIGRIYVMSRQAAWNRFRDVVEGET